MATRPPARANATTAPASPYERLESAQQQRRQQERVLEMVAVLRDLIAGRKTRAEVMAWADVLGVEGRGQGGPFRWPEAATVFTSLALLDERHGDARVVRDVDLRAYLRWLTEGESFHADDDPLCLLEHDIDDFAAQTGTEAHRWWLEGLGWYETIRFCAPARSWPFLAHARLDRPGLIDFRKRRSDDFNAAIVELFEALAIDDSDVCYIHAQVDVAALPVWVLWRQDDNGNVFEMARFRSYAKACAQEQIYTARGHHQMYWVAPLA